MPSLPARTTSLPSRTNNTLPSPLKYLLALSVILFVVVLGTMLHHLALRLIKICRGKYQKQNVESGRMSLTRSTSDLSGVIRKATEGTNPHVHLLFSGCEKFQIPVLMVTSPVIDIVNQPNLQNKQFDIPKIGQTCRPGPFLGDPPVSDINLYISPHHPDALRVLGASFLSLHPRPTLDTASDDQEPDDPLSDVWPMPPNTWPVPTEEAMAAVEAEFDNMMEFVLGFGHTDALSIPSCDKEPEDKPDIDETLPLNDKEVSEFNRISQVTIFPANSQITPEITNLDDSKRIAALGGRSSPQQPAQVVRPFSAVQPVVRKTPRIRRHGTAASQQKLEDNKENKPPSTTEPEQAAIKIKKKSDLRTYKVDSKSHHKSVKEGSILPRSNDIAFKETFSKSKFNAGQNTSPARTPFRPYPTLHPNRKTAITLGHSDTLVNLGFADLKTATRGQGCGTAQLQASTLRRPSAQSNRTVAIHSAAALHLLPSGTSTEVRTKSRFIDANDSGESEDSPPTSPEATRKRLSRPVLRDVISQVAHGRPNHPVPGQQTAAKRHRITTIVGGNRKESVRVCN